MVMINVALLCTNVTSALRPAMSSVVSMLEGKIAIKELILESSEVLDEKKMEAMRQYYKDHSISMEEGPWTATSSSVATDLYPVDSSYLEKRV
ncbi:putative cysteine-rich RLK (receptor-like kinase) protein [Trifolium pratense]|uniref:Putative cysteine-rich RLK (Receptor-like kinase) protein n=3 Tax=Trifolium pratense TaxID=57577 RepID=A0A2K3K767_TRIPR|nr:putative cysteine-rich RLK (receptor-like kinase) protein [Trifolium pratense]